MPTNRLHRNLMQIGAVEDLACCLSPAEARLQPHANVFVISCGELYLGIEPKKQSRDCEKKPESVENHKITVKPKVIGFPISVTNPFLPKETANSVTAFNSASCVPEAREVGNEQVMLRQSQCDH